MAFLLAVAIRRRQQGALEQKLEKYAMIIHNDTQRAAHDWQWETVNKIASVFQAAVENSDPRLEALFDEAYGDLSRSVLANEGHLLAPADAFRDVQTLISDGELNVQRVNSDTQLEPLLDPETAELRLRTKANVFIGGSILDRGITVPNLIAFYYGRNPKRMQADTVLQHSRMYGARHRDDLAVTRFYTSRGVQSRLAKIFDLETALRDAFESGVNDGGVVFIQSDSRNGFVPCAPSKIKLSDVVAVRANDILLPTGFDTIAASKLGRQMAVIDKLVPASSIGTKAFADIPLADAVAILDAIEHTLVLDEADGFEWDAMRGLFRYYWERAGERALIIAETGRRLDRSKSGDRSGLSILGTSELRNLVREPTRTAPALILLRQIGGLDLGWKAGPFWWPMLAAPPQATACVFATKVAA
jgi:hypothetical protein